jgi:hypothetical protein
MCYVVVMVAFELRPARAGACQSEWRGDFAVLSSPPCMSECPGWFALFRYFK